MADHSGPPLDRIAGHCPICRNDVDYDVRGPKYRDQLWCPACPGGSVPRERALALVLNELRPDWRNLRIHESSPCGRGISLLMARECKHYIPTQFHPDKPTGGIVNGARNENLEQLTFPDAAFDVVITLDVMEHVYFPDKVFAEIFRTLADGGVYICTFPMRKAQVTGAERRFELGPDGVRIDFKPPDFHGNPVSAEGSIVTFDYGYDVHQQIAEWAPFDVRVYRFADRTHGILGEYTDVVACQKPLRPR